MSERNPLVGILCTVPLIAMQGCHTNTEDTGSLGYDSVCYITSRIGWVSMKGIIYRCVDNDVDVVPENCTITVVIHI